MVLNMSLSALWSPQASDPPKTVHQTLSPNHQHRIPCKSHTMMSSNDKNKNNKWTKRRRSKRQNDLWIHDKTQIQQKNNIKSLHPVLNSSLVIINLVYLIICVSLINTIPGSTEALIVDPSDISMSSSSAAADNVDTSKSSNGAAAAAGTFSLDDALNRFNMENQIAAIFSRVSYGSTTTKRSISDLGMGQSSLTTIPTPFLTTNR